VEAIGSGHWEMFLSPGTYLLSLTGDKWSQETSILIVESHLVRKTSRGKGGFSGRLDAALLP
jgi:hypothetical protein